MNVLVETSIWSLAFRRRSPEHAAVDELRQLIAVGRAALIGPIRQFTRYGKVLPMALHRYGSG